jgi:hypothetical protein
MAVSGDEYNDDGEEDNATGGETWLLGKGSAWIEEDNAAAARKRSSPGRIVGSVKGANDGGVDG